MRRIHISTKTPIVLALFFCALSLLCLPGCSKKNEAHTPNDDKYNTYVFFGVDSRADDDSWKTGEDSTGTEEGGPSSDVIMLIRLDEETGDTKVVSVYRDTMLDISGDEFELDKCNSAYRNTGEYGAINMLEKNLDTRISGYVTANFKTVADCIDAMGGIEINVKREPLMDYFKDKGDDSIDVINSYIDEMNETYKEDTPHLTNDGLQVLNGIQAVAYSRLRYTEGADLRRAERQREVMMKMMEKLKSSDSSTQRTVMKQMYNDVNTDLEESELRTLFEALDNFNMQDTEGFPYYKKGKVKNKVYYLIPCDLELNVTELHKRLYGEEEYEANEYVKEVSQQIIDFSGYTSDSANEKWNDAY